MSITFKIDKDNIRRIIITYIFAAVLFFQSDCPLYAVSGFCVLYFFIKNLEIKIKEKWNWLLTVLMLGGSSALTTFLIQYLLLDAELRAKTSYEKLGLNVLCCLVLYLLLQALVSNTGLACIISHITLVSFGGINYFVYLFRGNEFIFSDIRSIQTGLSVAGNYEFTLDERAACVILISALYVALVRKLHITFARKKVWMRILCISLGVLCCAFIGNETKNTMTETWEQKGSYRNGYVLNFVLSVRDYFVAEPEGYSADVIAELEAEYAEADQKEAAGIQLRPGEKPDIIVIMSESYADLRVLGNFHTNEEITPYFDSLKENTIRGYALSSVFGAKTPNSEWEFLTGNSMAFLPGGSVVYQQYMNEEPNSLVYELKNLGYTCVAMHPYYATGWSRNTVYPKLGFDEMHFIEAFDQTKLMRKYVTDQEFYEKIIERYESRASNENLFLMGISMQNHGGYTEDYDNFKGEIRLLGMDYPDANQYVSLLHESDAALEYLIHYFENVEEPVEIVFFGDHLPSLNSGFFRKLNGKGLSGLTEDELEELYTVPFFIWTNYESEAETIEITSLNYLSTLALERAGIELPAYHRFLADMMDTIPAINSRGYYSLSEGGFWHIEDAAGEEAEWIRKYEILQYNNLFDRKKKSEVFFPYFE